MAAALSARTKAFIGFHHADERFLKRLQTQLTPLTRQGLVDVWDETRTKPGGEWRVELQQAVQSAKVAVLLVSDDFLASDFIDRQIVHPLVQAAQNKEVTLISILVDECLYEESPLEAFRFLNDEPLSKRTKAQQDEILSRAARTVRELVRTPASTPAPTPEAPSSQPSVSVPVEAQEPPLPIAERYRQAILADQSLTKLQVLDMRSPLPITQIYVRLQVHEETSRVSPDPARQAARDPLSLVGQRQRELQERFSSALDPADALRKYSHCVVLGDPGAGKTTLLKYLAIQAASGEVPDLPRVPIFVSLRAFASSNSQDLLAFAAATCSSRYRAYGLTEGETLAYMQEQMQAGNALLLLDALDETTLGTTVEAAEASYKRVADEVMRLANSCPWVVVTARRAGYRQRSRLHAFSELEVLDFRTQEIEQFIESWFGQHPREALRGYATELKQQLAIHPRMQALAANPLLLTLITLYYEEHMTLPERRASLYKECVDLLLHKWDASRTIPRLHAFKEGYQRQLLQEIAWEAQQQGRASLPTDTLLPLIARFLPEIGMKAELATEVLAAMSGDTGLLRKQAEGIYGFFHLTLQEYFASQHVEAIADLLPYLGDPWWEEVILLYVGCARNATPLLEHLLLPDGPGEVPEDIFASKLLLAGRCIAANPTIQRGELWTVIPDRLLHTLTHTDSTLTRQQVAETLAEIGRAYLEKEAEYDVNTRLLALLVDEYVSEAVKMTITQALAMYGARALALRLLAILVDGAVSYTVRYEVRSALGRLADSPLLPELLALVMHEGTSPLLAIDAAYCLGEAGDATIAQRLLPLLARPSLHPALRQELATSIALLGDEAVISSLLTLVFVPGMDTELASRVVLTLSSRRYRPASQALLALLDQPQVEGTIRLTIVFALSHVGDPAIAQRLATLTYHPQLGLVVRGACAMAFVMCGIRTYQVEILRMLADSSLAPFIRANMAWVLGEHGNKTFLAPLRSLFLQEQDEEVRANLRIALGLLDDVTVLLELHEAFTRGTLPTPVRFPVARVIAQDLSPSQLTTSLKDASIAAEQRVLLAQSLGETDRSALVPDLLSLLADRVVIEEVRIALAETIGKLGEKRATVEELLKLWRYYALRDPLHTSVLVDALHQALWSVSRRAGVTVVQVGTEYRVV